MNNLYVFKLCKHVNKCKCMFLVKTEPAKEENQNPNIMEAFKEWVEYVM